MKKNKTKTISLLAGLAMVANLIFPAFASAYSFSVPYGALIIDSSQMLSMSDEIMQRAETRYGIDSDIWRRAQRKESAPRVEIFFDITNPKPGEKVTAHAVPEYFKNDPQNLYYTWYLIHTENGTSQTATNTISDGKREAQKIMARGDYDPDLDGQNYSSASADPDQDGWPAVDANSYDEDDVAAPMGGADGVGGLAEGNDNIEPYDSGNEYCSTRGNHSSASQCNLYTEKTVFNQYYNLTPDQSGDYCTSCQQSLSFTSTLTSNNQCCYLVFNPSDPGLASYDPNIDYCPSTYVAAYESCFDYAGLASTNTALINSCLNTAYQSCITTWDNLHLNPSGNEPVGNVSRCYKHNFGINNPSYGFRGYQGDSNSFGDDSSGLDYVTNCIHKWKDAPGYTSGSGRFSTGEEEYWKTDPTDPDTDGDGYVDEADIVGLGQQDFTWNYQAGDRVGVVVEGTSMIPVDEKSAYYKIMWGYPDVCDSTKVGLMDSDQCNDSSDYGYGFLATRSPNEQGEDKLKISLSYSPENPLADPSDENADNISSDGTIADADIITVLSSLDNTDYDPNDLYYTWQISKGDPATDNWSEVKDIGDNFSTTSPSSGMGITQFNFAPKKDIMSGSGDIVYFKVTLTASKASDLEAGRGRSSVIIPVNKKGIQISLHKVDIEDGKAVIGDEVCNEGLYKSLCPVIKGQMLAAKVSGSHYTKSNSTFSWKLNDQPLYPPSNASQYFSGWSSTSVFLPITKEEQQVEELSVTATSQDELQPATGTRLATVVHPALFIKSNDTSVSWPKVYQAENPDKKYNLLNIESQNLFEALKNEEVSYYLQFVPSYLIANDPLNTLIDWNFNGASLSTENVYESVTNISDISVDNDGKTLKFTTGDVENQFLTLGAEVTKYWTDEERNILFSAWGLNPETLHGETSVNITTVAENSSDANDVWGTIGQAGPGQVLAAIGTHLPHYFMYLLRLTLTMVVMFVLSAAFYGVTQKLSLINEEK